MPESVTKKRLTNECIRNMVKKAFGCEPDHISELTEGFFNVAYKVQLQNQTVILKVAPPDDLDVMTNEKNIMYSEFHSMQMVNRKTTVPVPEILFYDTSHTVCERNYFFMEMLEGASFSSCIEEYNEVEKYNINYEVGTYTRMLNELTNDKFGYYGQNDRQGDCWYEVFKSMIEDAYIDADRKGIKISVERERLLTLLEKNQPLFESVKKPKFVHWDIWAGNVFVNNKKIVGIIDFERCMWADELMEYGFRSFVYEQGFYDGYGVHQLSDEQKQRAKWYDIYLFLLMCLECDYRSYTTRDAYHWGYDGVKNLVESMES